MPQPVKRIFLSLRNSLMSCLRVCSRTSKAKRESGPLAADLPSATDTRPATHNMARRESVACPSRLVAVRYEDCSAPMKVLRGEHDSLTVSRHGLIVERRESPLNQAIVRCRTRATRFLGEFSAKRDEREVEHFDPNASIFKLDISRHDPRSNE
jgi:hypothetical protein